MTAPLTNILWFALYLVIFGVPLFSMWDMLRAGERPQDLHRAFRWLWALTTMAVTLTGMGLVPTTAWWLWGRPGSGSQRRTAQGVERST